MDVRVAVAIGVRKDRKKKTIAAVEDMGTKALCGHALFSVLYRSFIVNGCGRNAFMSTKDLCPSGKTIFCKLN